MGEALTYPILSATYKTLSVPILKKSIDKGLKLIESLKSDFSVLGQELTFLCPENLEEWSVVFQYKKGLIAGKKSFLFPSIRKVNVNSIVPLEDVTQQCINMIPGGSGFELNYKSLKNDVPYILRVEFDVENHMFIDNLVYRKVQEDTLHEYRKYWMQAQLRFVDVLEKMFSNIKFEDLDFDVRVSTHEDIRTAVPSIFKRELEVIVKWMSESDRERKSKLSMEHLRLLRARRGGNIKHGKSILELIQELQGIFLPKTFRSFIQVERDFYYHDCRRGADYYAAPFPTFPKFMTVITRTNLGLNKPAAEGTLLFNYQDFRSRIETLFNRFL
jgi:hypothetical protein